MRVTVYFYAFLFFEDWRQDLWMKRFMRDHVRYVDEIQCAAARVVEAMRTFARSRPNNLAGRFDAFHIRRGDFQYQQMRIGATEIYQNVKDVLPHGAVVFIATDEQNKTFFDPLRKQYTLKFLDDFRDELQGININMLGMIDQLIAARGNKFFGCWHSTYVNTGMLHVGRVFDNIDALTDFHSFTGYIMRLRAYHAIRDNSPGYENGVLPDSYYYTPQGARDAMHRYSVLHGAFFKREFPIGWRDIDKDIEYGVSLSKE